MNYQWLDEDEETVGLRNQLAKHLEKRLGIETRLDGFLPTKPSGWVPKVDALVETLGEFLDQAAALQGPSASRSLAGLGPP